MAVTVDDNIMESSGSLLVLSTIKRSLTACLWNADCCISLTAAILSLNWKWWHWALYQFPISLHCSAQQCPDRLASLDRFFKKLIFYFWAAESVYISHVSVCTVCVSTYTHVSVHLRGNRAGCAGRRGLPWSLSITQSGVSLLAIISPVTSRDGPPPHHISLCQFTRCLWTEPRSMKLHVTVIITFGDTCCFSPRLHHKMSPLLLGLGWFV